jgi:hypothetical protein
VASYTRRLLALHHHHTTSLILQSNCLGASHTSCSTYPTKHTYRYGKHDVQWRGDWPQQAGKAGTQRSFLSKLSGVIKELNPDRRHREKMLSVSVAWALPKSYWRAGSGRKFPGSCGPSSTLFKQNSPQNWAQNMRINALRVPNREVVEGGQLKQGKP